MPFSYYRIYKILVDVIRIKENDYALYIYKR